MKNSRLTGWITVSANVAVLIGIALIVVELGQNRDSLRAQTRNELSSKIVDFLSMIASDGELASIRRRADAGEELTVDEAMRCELLTIANVRYMENVHYQYRQGLFDEVEYNRQKEAWRGYVTSSKRFPLFWCKGKHLYSPKFVSEMDGLLAESSC